MHALVVSYGSIGRRHVHNLNRMEVVDRLTLLRRPTTKNRSEEIPDVDRVVFDRDEAISLQPDFAVVASPASTHLDYATPLAEAGVNLLIEKPISDDLGDTRRFLERFEDGDIQISVGYNFRFYEPLRQVHKAVKQGKIGRILGVRAAVGSYLPDWRERDYRETVSAQRRLGGGALLELSHEIDLVEWIAGPITSVGALTGQHGDLEIDVEDTAEILVEIDGEIPGNIHIDMVQKPPDRWLKLIGTEGIARWNWTDHTALISTSSEDSPQILAKCPKFDPNAMYVHELEEFVRAIQENTSLSPTPREGLRVLKVVEAARQSSKSGKRIKIGPTH